MDALVLPDANMTTAINRSWLLMRRPCTAVSYGSAYGKRAMANRSVRSWHELYGGVGFGPAFPVCGPRIIAGRSRAIDSAAIRGGWPVACTIGGFNAALCWIGRRRR